MSAHHGNSVQAGGVVGFFDDSQMILSAMKKVKESNYLKFDAHTPFPIHGMDDAMGLKRSPIPLFAFGAGITGTGLAFALQYWTSKVDWPLIVGGKPFNSWPAFVPVMFEVTVLFAGITTLLSLLALCRLPNVLKKVVDPSVTRDRFAIVIESPASESELHHEADKGFKKFDYSEAEGFLKSLGAKDVRRYQAEGWF